MKKDNCKLKVLILGATGMLGNALFRYLSEKATIEVVGSIRNDALISKFPAKYRSSLYSDVDVLDHNELERFFLTVNPDIVVNCVGIIKQLSDADDPLITVPINSLLPHRLDRLCALTEARLIHISTDCVFSGRKGGYDETNVPDASDLYGRSKLIGEVDNLRSITLRTSLIGHELVSARGLVDWFLSQEGEVRGYRKAIFSGLPTTEIARVIYSYVLTNPDLHGIYHLSGDPISKFDLLNLIAQVYSKKIEIIPDDLLRIDRSLNSTKFQNATEYLPKPWPLLIQEMHDQRY